MSEIEEVARKQQALVGDDTLWRYVIREAKRAGRTGEHGLILWVLGRPVHYYAASALDTLPWPDSETRARALAKVAAYDPSAQVVLMTVVPSEVLIGIYNFDRSPYTPPTVEAA